MRETLAIGGADATEICRFLGPSSGLRSQNPRPEAGSPKEIRSPKPEATARLAAVAADRPEAHRFASGSFWRSRAPPPQLDLSGIRISALLRLWGFGLRIFPRSEEHTAEI